METRASVAFMGSLAVLERHSVAAMRTLARDERSMKTSLTHPGSRIFGSFNQKGRTHSTCCSKFLKWYSGDVVEVEILRDGEVMTLQTALVSPNCLVPVHIDGKQPSYLIVAGLVFTVVSQPFLESHFGSDYYDAHIPVKILEKATYGMPETEDEQLVVVSQVLASDVNIGYEDIEATQALTFNGIKIRNLKQLVQLADSCTERYFQIELDNQMLVVIDTEQARAGIPQILRDHCISADRSQDLL